MKEGKRSLRSALYARFVFFSFFLVLPFFVSVCRVGAELCKESTGARRGVSALV